MATTLNFTSITNLYTGTTVSVTLDGTASGSVVFTAAKNVDIATPQTISATGTFPNYTLTLPAPGVWFLWVTDNSGTAAAPLAPYVGLADNESTDAVGNALAVRLNNCKPALDWILQTVYPGSTFKQISYGVPGNIIEFPSVVITNPKWRGDRFATNYLTKNSYEFTIAFMAAHNTEQNQLPMIVNVAQRAATVLNQKDYMRLNLPSGDIVADCMVREGDYADFELPDLGFCATGTLVWSGYSYTQDSY